MLGLRYGLRGNRWPAPTGAPFGWESADRSRPAAHPLLSRRKDIHVSQSALLVGGMVVPISKLPAGVADVAALLGDAGLLVADLGEGGDALADLFFARQREAEA